MEQVFLISLGIITKIQMILILKDKKMAHKVLKTEEKQFRNKTSLLKRIKESLIIKFKKNKNLQQNKFIIQML
jgi:hypothetical protein